MGTAGQISYRRFNLRFAAVHLHHQVGHHDGHDLESGGEESEKLKLLHDRTRRRSPARPSDLRVPPQRKPFLLHRARPRDAIPLRTNRRPRSGFRLELPLDGPLRGMSGRLRHPVARCGLLALRGRYRAQPHLSHPSLVTERRDAVRGTWPGWAR